MQHREITNTNVWLLWLLFGAVALLGGCIAPDGTVFMPQVAPNGSIVGWQVDASVATDGESTAGYPPRPILFYDGIRSIKATNADGTALRTVGDGALVGLSHQGDRFAYQPVGEDGNGHELTIASFGQEQQTPIQVEVSGIVPFPRYSIWSPDDTHMAFVTGIGPTGVMTVTIVDTSSGQVAGELPFMNKLPSTYNFGLLSVTYPLGLINPWTVNWSPDGQKVLWNYLNMGVIDVKSGAQRQLYSPQGAGSSEFIPWAEWLPSSDSIIYATNSISDVTNSLNSFDNGEALLLPQLWRIGLDDEEAVPLLTTEQLLQFGFNVDDHIGFSISPNGIYLALLSANPGNGEDIAPHSQLVILDLSTLQAAAQWKLAGIIASLAWGPDEKEVAFFRYLDKAGTVEVMDWKEGVSRIVGEIAIHPDANSADAVGIMEMGLNLVSWTP